MTKCVGFVCALFFITIVLTSEVTQSGESGKTVWHQKMLVRDRITKEDGRLLDLFGFSLSNGDVLIEIDQVNQQIISISGSFHHVDPLFFDMFQSRLSGKPLEGWSIQSSTNGENADHTIRMDLKNLGLTFSEDFIWALRSSENMDLQLTLERDNSKHVFLSLEMQLGDSLNPSLKTMKLIKDVQI